MRFADEHHPPDAQRGGGVGQPGGPIRQFVSVALPPDHVMPDQTIFGRPIQKADANKHAIVRAPVWVEQ